MQLPTGPLAGLSALAARYRGLFCDVWGVVHNGRHVYPAAAEALCRYREAGGRVVLVTNAPRPGHAVRDQLDALGVPRAAYDAMVTSGDCTLALLENFRGGRIDRVGPPEDDVLLAGMDIRIGTAHEAAAVLVTDLDTDDDTPALYADRMAVWRARGLPLICANPDKVVEEGERIVYCGGALADAYEALGGTVAMAGKPYDPIYRVAQRLLDAAGGAPVARDAILAIGDSVRTDAVGAAQYGVDLLFVTGSIHAAELDAFNDPPAARVRDLVAPSRANLVGYLPRLAW